jgi:hypothetical protein
MGQAVCCAEVEETITVEAAQSIGGTKPEEAAGILDYAFDAIVGQAVSSVINPDRELFSHRINAPNKQ